MKKFKILLFVMGIIILFSGCSNKDSRAKKTDGTVSPTISAPSVTITPTISPVPSIAASNQAKSEETDQNKPEDFTEGVWIKRYPTNSACFKFETPKELKVVCDPFEMNERLQPDIVTESHDHGDHADTTRLIQPYDLITTTGEFDNDGVKITGYSGKHNVGDGRCTNIMYVFDFDDIRIAHFASQGELPSDDILDQIGTVDVLLIQVFPRADYKKLTVEDYGKIAAKLNPKIVIPEHGSSDAPAAIAEYENVELETIDSGNLVVTRDMLDQIEDVRVIDLFNYHY